LGTQSCEKLLKGHSNHWAQAFHKDQTNISDAVQSYPILGHGDGKTKVLPFPEKLRLPV